MNRRESIRLAILGTASLPGVLSVFFQRCNSIRESGNTWVPEFFDKPQSDLIVSVVDTILPPTETPGAASAMVHVFVDLYAKDCLTADQQKQLKDGLQQLEKSANSEHQKSFASLPQQAREEILSAMEKEGIEFIKLIKPLTLLGYFSSREGATKAADYNPVPGPFQGCVPAGNMKVSALS